VPIVCRIALDLPEMLACRLKDGKNIKMFES
jgi:hypothetical protein